MRGARKKNPPNSNRRQSPNNDSKRRLQQSVPDNSRQTSVNQKQNSVIDPPQVNTEMKDLVKSVVDLKIINDVNTLKADSSQPTKSTPKSNPSKPTNNASNVEQPAKSKEEIVAERKAKAAEAKAKKAAAAAAKKTARGGEGATATSASEQNNKKQQLGGGVQIQKQQQQHSKAHQDSKSKVARQKDSDSAMSTSNTAANPNNDMTPSEGANVIGRRRQPSFTDVSTINVHPAFLSFAARCEAKEVTGIDAICVAFICAFKQFLNDYKMSENRKMSHDLDQAIRPHFSYMTQNGTQPFPFALGNLIRQLKKEINQLPDGISELDGKNELREWLDDFCSQNFDLALRAISSFCLSKMQSTHYILTYSWCPIVERVLLDAYDQKMNLHVCILDSPVEPKGRRLTKTLSSRNIECTYGMLSAIGYVMKQCRMVLLGCSAILSNGYVVAERGAAQVALVAAAANVPVLVVAQTLKFVDRVQTFDRGNREVSALVGERQESIPSDLITAVVTELRIVPPSSAPAVLKAKQLAVG